MKEPEMVPVYLIAGFLESGKTTMIESMLLDEDFTGGEEILVICCEEGEEEYNPEAMAKGHAHLVVLEDPSELSSLKMKQLNEQFHPQRVMIEYNTMWGLEKFATLRPPAGWRLVQVITLADSGTMANYMTNMRTQMSGPLREADLILVNRCAPDFNKSYWRKQLRALNPNATILFENLDGSTEDGVTDEDLPYDMKADVIDIAEDQFGLFYLDAMDHPERYDMRTVRLVGQAFPEERAPEGFCFFGRYAMTCCSNDISECGWYCQGTMKPGTGAFFRLTALCKMVEQAGQKGIMLIEQKAEPSKPTKEEYVSFVNI